MASCRGGWGVLIGNRLFHPKVIFLEDIHGHMVLGAGSANLEYAGAKRNQEVFIFRPCKPQRANASRSKRFSRHWQRQRASTSLKHLACAAALLAMTPIGDLCTALKNKLFAAATSRHPSRTIDGVVTVLFTQSSSLTRQNIHLCRQGFEVCHRA